MMHSMVKVYKYGMMDQNIKDNISKDRNMEKENFCGQTDRAFKDNFKIIIYMVLEHIYGQTVENMLANGLIIKCKGRVRSFGLMEEHTRVTILMIRNKVLEYMNGLMGENIKDSGKTENRMERENIIRNKVNVKLANGAKAKELDGSQINIYYIYN